MNDVDGGNYTGFSLLGDDLLGDIFGTTGGKKSHKNKNKKKQAPSSSTTTTTTTTTTTKRPRPSRRPTRRTTTPRPPRTTTVRVRPTSRKPNRRRPTRPNRRTTTPSTILTYPVTSQENSQTSKIQTTEYNTISDSPLGEHSLKPVILTSASSDIQTSTPNAQTATNIEDPGLQLSLAHITGQLSEMPVTTIISTVKDGISGKNKLRYEKIQTITPKNPSTVSFSSTSKGEDSEMNDDMIQIVQTLDSESSEHIPASVEPTSDESRGQKDFLHNYYSHSNKINGDYYEGLSLPKKKHKKHNSNDEYDDVLGLTSIGESIIHGYQSLGLNGGKRKHKNKVGDGRKNNNDYDDILGFDAISETLGLENGNKNEKKRNNKEGRRKHKMMRGDWAAV